MFMVACNSTFILVRNENGAYGSPDNKHNIPVVLPVLWDLSWEKVNECIVLDESALCLAVLVCAYCVSVSPVNSWPVEQ